MNEQLEGNLLRRFASFVFRYSYQNFRFKFKLIRNWKSLINLNLFTNIDTIQSRRTKVRPGPETRLAFTTGVFQFPTGKTLLHVIKNLQNCKYLSYLLYNDVFCIWNILVTGRYFFIKKYQV